MQILRTERDGKLRIRPIDERIQSNCWNLRESQGKTCVFCNCCDRGNVKRYRARIIMLELWLQEAEDYDRWSSNPEYRRLQEIEVKEEIESLKSQLQFYNTVLDAELKKRGEKSAGCQDSSNA